MLEMKKISDTLPELKEVRALYDRAFPENERRDFSELIGGGSEMEMLAFYDEDLFVGFAVLLNSKIAISHIIYFAVEESLRDRGYGSMILAAIHEAKAGRRIMVDIERQTEEADNNPQRLKRKQFYLRNGYTETEVKYRWRDEDYEILVYGGELTRVDYESFWKNLKRENRK